MMTRRIELNSADTREKNKRTPMRDFEPGDGVVLDDLGSAVDGAGVADTPNHGSNSDVRHDHGVSLGPGEEDRVG